MKEIRDNIKNPGTNKLCDIVEEMKKLAKDITESLFDLPLPEQEQGESRLRRSFLHTQKEIRDGLKKQAETLSEKEQLSESDKERIRRKLNDFIELMFDCRINDPHPKTCDVHNRKSGEAQ